MAVRQTGVKIPAKWQQSLICSSVFQQPEAMESELWFKSEWLEKKAYFLFGNNAIFTTVKDVSLE